MNPRVATSKGLIATALAASLAACNGTQNGRAALPPSIMAQSRAHKQSGSYGDLLYVFGAYGATLVSYPALQIVGNFSKTELGNVCSDPNTGNVFVPNGDTEVLEYAHGGTTPIATLTVPSGYSFLHGCSVDPTTGNLAVAAYFGPLFIFPGGQGNPIVYSPKEINLFLYGTYDNAGNLFVPATTKKGKSFIAELPAGQNKFTFIKPPSGLEESGLIAWDGTHLVFSVFGKNRGSTIYQMAIAKGKASVVGKVRLIDAGASQYWFYNGTVFQAYWKIKHNKDAAVATWAYPQGGKPTAVLYGVSVGKKTFISGLTLSVAPSAPGPNTRKAAP